jgi:hypothetical protein
LVNSVKNPLPSYLPFHFDAAFTKVFTGTTTNTALGGTYDFFVKA